MSRVKLLHFDLGLCPMVISLEEIDHEEGRRFVHVYDVVSGLTARVEISYNPYSLSDLKAAYECLEETLKKVGGKTEDGKPWECPYKETCPLKRRRHT